MKWKFTMGFLMVVGAVCLCLTIPNEIKAEVPVRSFTKIQGEKKALIELIRKWEAKYNVLFTYDRRIVESVEVEVPDNEVENIDKALDFALNQTELKYTILESRYVILYKNDREGIESLENMIQHLSKIIDSEKKTMAKKVGETVDRLYTHSALDIYNKRLVINVSGTITNQAGEPLIGVNVLVKGTDKGTATDFDGKFSLEDIDEEAILVVSYIGYQTQEVALDGDRSITVTLLEDSQTLDEVVVVGYGTQRKSDLTGSVASIGSEQFSRQPIIRTEDALKSRTPGVTVQKPNGAPGAGMKIRIRGFNSINGNNSPLYVIDGFIGGDITTVNPNDIQSIDVLKDASATAIYGSRGSNGVIIITTKSGNSGQFKVDFDAFYSFDKVSNELDLLSTEEYMNVVNERNVSLGLNPVFSSTEIDSVVRSGGTNWLDQILRTGGTQNYQLALSGGGQNTQFYISGSLADQQGIVKNSFYKRYGIRANLKSKLVENMNLDFNIYANHTDARNNYTYEGRSSALGAALVYPPNLTVFNSRGQYTESPASYGPTATQPVYEVTERNFDKRRWNTMARLKLDYSFLEDFTFSVMGGVNGIFSNSPTWKRYQPGAEDKSTSEAIQSDNFYYRLQNTNMLEYSNDFDRNNNLNVAIIYEQQITKSMGNYSYATGLSSNSLEYYRLQLGANQQVSSGYSDESLQSYLGRLNYSFKEKYLLTLSFRADGSSKFAENNKYGFFPSAALAWRISNEEFFMNNNLFDELKARVSYGKVGSQAINPYQTLTTLVLNEQYPITNNSMSIGIGPGTPSNPDLKWETTSQANVGVDFGFANGRISGAIDYYYKKTNDLLLNVPVPRYAGGGTTLKNVGSVENKGFEFLLSGTLVEKNRLRLSSSVNFSINRNKVLSLGKDTVLYFGNFILRPGEPISQFFGLTYEGTWKSEEVSEADIYNKVPGDPRYRDFNGDQVIGTEDMRVLGTPLPDVTWGWNTTFEYKNFDINLLINGVLGNKVWNHTRFLITGSGDAVPTSKEILNRWTSENNESNIPGFSSTSISRSNSDQWLEDGSFTRISNLSLGYTLMNNMQNNSFTSARIYFSIQNLAVFTNYTGYDPELSTAPLGSDTIQGIDNSTYPAVRTFTLGTKIVL